MTISWETKNENDIGTYLINIIAEIHTNAQTFANNIQFNLSIKKKSQNQVTGNKDKNVT